MWFEYTAGGNGKYIPIIPFTSTAWFSFGLSWSKTDDKLIAYLNGSQAGSPVTSLGNWSGKIASANIGSVGTSLCWHGWMSYFAVKFGAIWSSSDFANLHSAAATAAPD